MEKEKGMKRQGRRRKYYHRFSDGSTQGLLKHAKRANWRTIHFNNQGGLCFYCESPMKTGSKTSGPTLDHYMPLALGGPDSFENTVAACAACNHAKGDVDGDVYMDILSALRA